MKNRLKQDAIDKLLYAFGYGDYYNRTTFPALKEIIDAEKKTPWNKEVSRLLHPLSYVFAETYKGQAARVTKEKLATLKYLLLMSSFRIFIFNYVEYPIKALFRWIKHRIDIILYRLKLKKSPIHFASFKIQPYKYDSKPADGYKDNFAMFIPQGTISGVTHREGFFYNQNWTGEYEEFKITPPKENTDEN